MNTIKNQSTSTDTFKFSQLAKNLSILILAGSILLYVAGYSYRSSYYNTLKISTSLFPVSYEQILFDGAMVLSKILFKLTAWIFVILIPIPVVLNIARKITRKKRTPAYPDKTITRVAYQLKKYWLHFIELITSPFGYNSFLLLYFTTLILIVITYTASFSRQLALKDCNSVLTNFYKTIATHGNDYLNFFDVYICNSEKADPNSVIYGKTIHCSGTHCAVLTINRILIIPMSEIREISTRLLDYEKALDIAKTMAANSNYSATLGILEGFQEDPKITTDGYLLIGIANEQLDNYEKALQIYMKILNIDPDHTIALNNIAYLYLDKNNERALVYAEKAFNSNKHTPHILDTYGLALIKNNNFSKGLEMLKKANKADPENLEIKEHLDLALQMERRRKEAQSQNQKKKPDIHHKKALTP
ncbi:MAG: hypothetical protein D3926_06055 [Desulfobacteraceae bacterium]|nr:MAG: hypothetical protein D3926_06055 [Desulfobacteraceae bacterium]